MVELAESVRTTNKPSLTEKAKPPQTQNARGSKLLTLRKNRPRKAIRKHRDNQKAQRRQVHTPATQTDRAKKREKRRNKKLCSACGEILHAISRCYLVLGLERNWLSQESRDTFNINMEVTTFKNKVEKFRKALTANEKNIWQNDNTWAEVA